MSIVVKNFKTMFPAVAAYCDSDSLDALLNVMTEQSVSTGNVIIKEGEETGNLYFVMEGELTSKLHGAEGDVEMGTVNAGNTFCNENLIAPGPACNTVTAKTDVVLLVLSYKDFRQLEKDHLQMTGNILRMLSDKLTELCRNADRMLFNHMVNKRELS